MALFCIITTCFNAEDCITETIESVLKQDFRDFEYIIMDGMSKDNTLKIAGSYMDKFAQAGIPYHIYSESDHGIYEGMNHGVCHAEGKYVNFMNAGDCLYDKYTLSNLASFINSFSEKEGAAPDLIYGDAAAVEFGQTYKYFKDLDMIGQKMPFSHQSVFASKKLLNEYPFKQELRIGADYDFLLSVYQNGYVMADSEIMICSVTLDGLSSVDLLHTFEETVAIQRNHGIDLYPGEAYDKKLKSFKKKQFVMDHFPKGIIKAIRKAQRIKRGQNEQLK